MDVDANTSPLHVNRIVQTHQCDDGYEQRSPGGRSHMFCLNYMYSSTSNTQANSIGSIIQSWLMA